MNIVIDSNIWISGIFWNGKPKNLLKILERDILSCYICKEMIDEIDGNLNAIKDDPDDNIILETAIKSKSEFLISGDNHLLDLKKYDNIKIISCRDFIDMLESNKI